METPRYCIVSAVHGRPEVASAWARWLVERGPRDLQVFVAGDDKRIEAEMGRHLGGQLVWIPYCNDPLGAKWNRALEHAADFAMRSTHISHVVILGSDDFPSSALFAAWQKWAEAGETGPLCASHLVVHGLAARETRFLADGTKFGSGRMYCAQDLHDLFYSQGFAWTPSIQKGLDNDLMQNLGLHWSDLSTASGAGLFTVKTDTQIHSFEKLVRKLSEDQFPEYRTLPNEIAEWLAWVRPKVRPAELVTIRTH